MDELHTHTGTRQKDHQEEDSGGIEEDTPIMHQQQQDMHHAIATSSEQEQQQQHDSLQEQVNPADATEEILYYVDEDGNPIDPDDMGEYALQEQEDASAIVNDTSMLLDEVDSNEKGRISGHANGQTEEQDNRLEAGLAEDKEQQQLEEADEQEREDVINDDIETNQPDLSRYVRPFVPPPETDDIDGDTNQEALPPDYNVRYTITGHRKNVSCVRFSPNGEWLITAGGDGRVLLYALPNTPTNKTDKPIFIRSYIIPNPEPIKFEPNQNKNSIPPVGSSGINDICFMPNNNNNSSNSSNYFAVASDDKIVRIWKINNLPRDEDVLDDSLRDLYHSNKNNTSSINDSDMNGGEPHQENRHSTGSYSNGQEDNTVVNGSRVAPSSLLSKSTEKPIELKGHKSFIFCLAFTPQNNLLASGSFDETIKIWDLKKLICLKTLPAHSDPVSSVGFSGDGSILCSAGHDGLLRLWDTATGQCLKSLVDESNPPASHALFTPNSRYILVSSLDSTIRLWDYHAAVCIKTYTGHKNVKYSIPAIFVQPPKGKHGSTYILTGSEDGRIIFYDLQSRNISFTLPGHKEAPILCLAHDPHSGMLATCALERGVKEYTVKIWVDRNRKPNSIERANGH